MNILNMLNIVMYSQQTPDAGVDLVLAQSRRRLAGIGSTVVRRLVFAGKPLCVSSLYNIYM